MPVFLPLIAYLLFASLLRYALALFLYSHDRHNSEIRFMAVVTFVLGIVLLVFELPPWEEISPATKVAFALPVRAYTEAHRWTPAEEWGERD